MTAPLLTKIQFSRTAAAQKPGASYVGYRNYVTRTRARRAAAQQADPLGSLLTQFQGSLLTPAQQAAQARQSVNTQVAASLAGMRAATQAEQAQSNQQAVRAQGYAKALAGLTAPNPDEIQSGYQDAAARLKTYGTGLTGALYDAQQAEASKTSDALAAQGLHPDQVGSYDPAALRNTLQYSGVVIPATSLDEEGLNAAAQARFQRAGQVAQVGDIAQQYLAKTTAAQNQLAAERAQLEATRPGLYTTALNSAGENARQNMAALISALALQNTTANTTSEITSRGKTAGAAVTNAGTGRAKITGVNPKTGRVLPGFWNNPKVNAVQKIPTGYTVAADGSRLVPLPKPVSPTSGTTNAKNVQTMIQKAQKLALSTALGAPYSKPSLLGPELGGHPTPLLPYADAKQRLLKAYFPKSVWGNAQVLAMINDVLGKAGYTPPIAKPKGTGLGIVVAPPGRPASRK